MTLPPMARSDMLFGGIFGPSLVTFLAAGLDEGLPSFWLPRSLLYGESLYEERIVVTNDSAPSYIHRPRSATSRARSRSRRWTRVRAGEKEVGGAGGSPEPPPPPRLFLPAFYRLGAF
jgi:hypothetical protein